MPKIAKGRVDYSSLGRYPYLLLKWQGFPTEPLGEIRKVLELVFSKDNQEGEEECLRHEQELRRGNELVT